MKTLITGGAGFIGSHLSDRLLSSEEQVVILDDLSAASKDNLIMIKERRNISIIEGSILDQELVTNLMKDATHCYHLAASLGVEKINKDPIASLEINLKGSEIVLNAAANAGVRTLLASSSEVYGKNPSIH